MASFAPVAQDQLDQSLPHKTRHHHPWLIALAVIILAFVGLTVLGSVQAPVPYHCQRRNCHTGPPASTPLTPPRRYVSSKYGFALDYSTSNIAPSQMDNRSIAWDGTLSDNSEVAWSFTGVDAGSRDARALVDDAQSGNFGDATYAYTIPGADLGYTPGYGAVYDWSAAPSGGAAVHERLVIMAAVKKGVGVILVGFGPFQQTDPQHDSHPNPAQTPLVDLGDFEETVKSVTWPGDPPL